MCDHSGSGYTHLPPLSEYVTLSHKTQSMQRAEPTGELLATYTPTRSASYLHRHQLRDRSVFSWYTMSPISLSILLCICPVCAQCLTNTYVSTYSQTNPATRPLRHGGEGECAGSRESHNFQNSIQSVTAMWVWRLRGFRSPEITYYILKTILFQKNFTFVILCLITVLQPGWPAVRDVLIEPSRESKSGIQYYSPPSRICNWQPRA